MKLKELLTNKWVLRIVSVLSVLSLFGYLLTNNLTLMVCSINLFEFTLYPSMKVQR